MYSAPQAMACIRSGQGLATAQIPTGSQFYVQQPRQGTFAEQRYAVPAAPPAPTYIMPAAGVAIYSASAPQVRTISAADEAAQAAERILPTMDDHAFVTNKIKQKDMVFFSKTCPFVQDMVFFSKTCPFVQAKQILESLRPPVMDVELVRHASGVGSHGTAASWANPAGLAHALRLLHGAAGLRERKLHRRLPGNLQPAPKRRTYAATPKTRLQISVNLLRLEK
ncbi:unnamed protein product [Effrenium voratum]|uniref:Uncharacterized protein n=1 Tax=Effrenium voratum TaxID=2562239 RepID=A0AA36HL15_9DINO|nr:unnamed protein product [Effrenium voratum]CAJ1438613.1 unnamed protein product [Effrenium voratum]